ncbi:TetR/AcrR family transcriptional regulator [Allorhizobium sp. BGMRC 0089]|uniref:TetR/AcrR family transcriptional regulator n=1 Tax=Allorhizobium sonneratiae TaxID=2934936 RepID=UPI0020340944|nr:TetR/AcrR family transcriptional regulator [Allorhizobium sonneratiae]MCM2294125.1 TetR/AcrR family transcriptional regulator [Allorhizobium sonneratiae]
MNDVAIDDDQAEPGLRSRKKAKRRDEIISAAKELFARQGIDATTMADIAAACGISAPTVFNYFGSKDGVLIALISEGTTEARENDRPLHWTENTPLETLIINLFSLISRRTLEIAGKRVWRYAESAAIRHPQTELAAQYASVSKALIDEVSEFFAELDLKLRAQIAPQPKVLAQLFHDVWIQTFLSLITNVDQTLEEHEVILRERIVPLVHLLFEDDSIAKPRRKGSAA